MAGFVWQSKNLEHIDGHSVTPDEAEYVILHVRPPFPEYIGDAKYRVRGQTREGRYLQVREKGITKAWPKMSPAELARATRAFDDPSHVPPAVSEPAELAKRHRKALSSLRSKARSTARRDAAQVRITLQRQLLRRADDLATARGVNRSQVIAEGLEMLLART